MTPDRKNAPAIIRARIPDLTNPELLVLDNGVPLYTIRSANSQIARIDFIFRAGQAFEQNPLESSTVNMMLNEGTYSLTASQINEKLDFFGAVPGFFSEKDDAGLSVAFLSRYSDEILDLCVEMLFKPSFPPEEFESLMNKRLQWFDLRQERVQSLANDRFFEALFGRDHPYGRITRREDFKNLSAERLTQFHKSCYNHSGMVLIAAGNLTDQLISSVNSTLGKARETSLTRYTKQPLSREIPGNSFKIRKKDAVQSAIRIGSRTINKRNADYPALKITDTVLGGYFGSRLMKNIREKKGYTYGIHSSVVSLDLAGYFLISTEVGTKYTTRALKEIYSEIKKLQEEPLTEEELGIVKNYMSGELVRMFDGPFASADTFRSVWEFDLDFNYYMNMAEKINSITTDEIIHIARTYFKKEDLVEIVAGP